MLMTGGGCHTLADPAAVFFFGGGFGEGSYVRVPPKIKTVLLRRGHSDWSASSGQPSYYFLWPAASGRARSVALF